MNRIRIGLRVATVAAAAQLCLSTAPRSAWAEEGLQPGEAFVTRFSGISTEGGAPAIDTNGTVGSIIDVRSPGKPPKGEHWIDEPQRNPITAQEVGQVFGVALDDATPPNIYVAATSAFGLHLAPGTQEWMDGMWGQGGGPGSIYRISPETGKPELLTNVSLNGRENSGPALGNIAFDKASRKLFVSDLETGMIHRIDPASGRDLGTFDHGTQGRPKFFDAENRKQGSLPAIAFNPSSRARIADCQAGSFERTPACWNFASSGRRVWGIGVRRDADKSGSRLYYAVWSGPAFGQTSWNQASEDDKRNSVWSVRLGDDGAFDASDVRRELIVPDFFTQVSPRAGYSQPVSDISFSECGERPVMLLGERGGIRNLGLDKDNPFAFPHEARALRYELDQSGAWRPVGRYDIGFYDRKKEGAPYIRANCSGGIAFGLGYDESTWTVDQSKLDQFVWSTGDYLCSPEGPCHLPPAVQTSGNESEVSPASAQNQDEGDDSHVHGVQGMAESAFEQLLPSGALGAYPSNDTPYPASGPDQSYLIDTDENVGDQGGLIPEELTRNDATKIGDVAIYQICAKPRKPTPQFLLPPPPATATGWVPDSPPEIEGHSRSETHAQVSSHGTDSSHYRWGSHNPWWSHGRFHSHNRFWSHSRHGSHHHHWSHSRFHSHVRHESHNRHASHHRSHSHFQTHSHALKHSHHRFRSHHTKQSLGHVPKGSHNKIRSHSGHKPHGSHNKMLSHSGHKPAGSHTKIKSQHHTVAQSKGTHHDKVKSQATHHTTAQSKAGHHNVIQSKNKFHNAAKSSGTTLIHDAVKSKGKHHDAVKSKATHHDAVKSKATHHSVLQSKAKLHDAVKSKAKTHDAIKSKAKTHDVAKSKGTTHHNVVQSKAKLHSVAQSKAKTTTTKTTTTKTTKVHKPTTVKTTKVHKPTTVKTTKVHKPVVKTTKVHKPVVKTTKVHKPVVKSTPKVHKVTPVKKVTPPVKKKH